MSEGVDAGGGVANGSSAGSWPDRLTWERWDEVARSERVGLDSPIWARLVWLVGYDLDPPVGTDVQIARLERGPPVFAEEAPHSVDERHWRLHSVWTEIQVCIPVLERAGLIDGSIDCWHE